MMDRVIYGKLLRTIEDLQNFQREGYDYILNTTTNKLHKCSDFEGSHNLLYANLENFIGISNLGVILIDKLEDGAIIPIFDQNTGIYIGNYILNKCEYCF
ncbi:hypothetical protein WA1_23265 [Scytonema hofmannii PCC 7110]|uniref:Uncharacterized protein n=1 Tax=Scytonema hofmannii PCC 7110 TaxID=128403 RepID=A0A139X8M7_9CYAN|nr:hypothetical protein [Scytonema hofmannii]KYC41040.1 hypothetical protein WA1_23265 [Scytonema hofmannii PCC 7110]